MSAAEAGGGATTVTPEMPESARSSGGVMLRQYTDVLQVAVGEVDELQGKPPRG